MKYLLLLVLFNFETGSELTMDRFDDMAACERAAMEIFKARDSDTQVQLLEPDHGADVIEDMMIAYDANGDAMGMFSCSPLQAGSSAGDR